VDSNHIDDIAHGALANIVALIWRLEFGLNLLARVQQLNPLLHIEDALIWVILVQLPNLFFRDRLILYLRMCHGGDELLIIVEFFYYRAVVLLLNQLVHVDQVIRIRHPLKFRKQASPDEVDVLWPAHDDIFDLLLLDGVLDAAHVVGDHAHVGVVARLEALLDQLLLFEWQVVQLLGQRGVELGGFEVEVFAFFVCH